MFALKLFLTRQTQLLLPFCWRPCLVLRPVAATVIFSRGKITVCVWFAVQNSEEFSSNGKQTKQSVMCSELLVILPVYTSV